jgi:hypothetical protein
MTTDVSASNLDGSRPTPQGSGQRAEPQDMSAGIAFARFQGHGFTLR